MNAQSAPILEMRDVTKIFGNTAPGGGGVVATDTVSLAIAASPPRVLSIVGESGSGKTTVARALLGLNPPTSGQVLYRGRDVYKLHSGEMTTYRKEVQAIFQDPYGIYNPFYRIDRVFKMTLDKFKLASGKNERRELVEDALHAVSLRPADVLGRYPHQLSGGERQRVMLARAYLLRPKVIIADEPISMLDVAVRAIFMNILLDFKERYGMSTVFITHDLSTAYYLGGDIMVMARGRVVEEGAAETVMQQPKHPYTQLLLKSIPSPDPDERWQGTGFANNVAPPGAQARRDRCLFAERCPHVMAVCWQKRPPMFAAGEQRAACFLYDGVSPRTQAPAAAVTASHPAVSLPAPSSAD